MRLLSPDPVMHDLAPRAPVLHPTELLHQVHDPRVLVHHLQHQEPHFGELADVPQPLPSELPSQPQMKVPVSIGICKMCRRVYRPEVSAFICLFYFENVSCHFMGEQILCNCDMFLMC